MGSSGVQLLQRARRIIAQAGVAALAVALLALASAAQDTRPAKDLYLLVKQLRPELEAGSTTAVAEVQAIHAELRRRVIEQGATDRGTQFAQYYCAYEIARFDRTLDDLQRLDLYAEARELAVTGIAPTAAYEIAIREARLHRRSGRSLDARRVLSETAEQVEVAAVSRPLMLKELAEVERLLGDYGAALDTLDQALAARAAAREAAPELASYLAPLAWQVPAARARVYLALGLPDLAAPLVRLTRAGTATLDRADPRWRKDLISADQLGVNLQLVLEDHSGVVRRTAELLDDALLYPEGSEDRATLMAHLGAALGELGRMDSTRNAPAVRALEQVLATPGIDSFRAFSTELGLAELDLRAEDYARAEVRLTSARARVERWGGDQQTGPAISETLDLTTLEVRLAIDRGDGLEQLASHVPGVLDAYDQMLASWSSTPLRKAGIGFLQPAKRRAFLSEMTRLFLRVEGPEAGARHALDQLMRAQALGSLVRRAGFGPGTTTDVQEQLVQDRHGLLVYLLGPTRSHLFTIESDAVSHAELPLEDALVAARRAHWVLVSSPPGSGRDPREERLAASALGDLLLPANVRARLREWRAVTVVGGDLMRDVSFEALPIEAREPAQARWTRLGFELAVDHAPSLTAALFLAQRAQASRPSTWERDLLLVETPRAGPEVQRRFPYLAALEIGEARHATLVQSLDPERLETLSGTEATIDAFLAQDLSTVRVLQFLTHAARDDERERPAVLVLAPGAKLDGLLGSDEVETLTGPPLVMLTACRSGQGPTRRGDDGLSHLGGAWLSRGTQVVLLSSADLALGPTVLLSAHFHEHLGAGATPAEALRRARVELARQPEFTHPFFFGSVRVLGLGQVPLP